MVTKGEGEGQIRSMRLTDTKYYTKNRQAMKTYSMAQDIIVNILYLYFNTYN